MKKATFPGIVCTSIGYEYQLFSDEKYLYIVRLCREGRNDFSNVIGGPEEFKPILGNVRVNKMEAESVRCKSVRGKMSIVLNLDNESLRFVAKNRLNEDDLLEVFSEMPLRMTVSQKKALPVQIEMLEIGLFIASMALALPGILVKDLPGMAVIAQWVPVLWMLIPLVSVAVEGHKHHSSKARKPFSISVGVMAGLFSCLFMWLTPVGRPESWLSALLPGMGFVAAALIVYTVASRKLDWLALLLVAVVGLAFYAPGATLCLNELLQPRFVEETTASVVELVSEYDKGNLVYYVVLEANGVQSYHQISKSEYDLLGKSGAAQIQRVVGALGIEYVDVKCE